MSFIELIHIHYVTKIYMMFSHFSVYSYYHDHRHWHATRLRLRCISLSLSFHDFSSLTDGCLPGCFSVTVVSSGHVWANEVCLLWSLHASQPPPTGWFRAPRGGVFQLDFQIYLPSVSPPPICSTPPLTSLIDSPPTRYWHEDHCHVHGLPSVWVHTRSPLREWRQWMSALHFSFFLFFVSSSDWWIRWGLLSGFSSNLWLYSRHCLISRYRWLPNAISIGSSLPLTVYWGRQITLLPSRFLCHGRVEDSQKRISEYILSHIEWRELFAFTATVNIYFPSTRTPYVTFSAFHMRSFPRHWSPPLPLLHRSWCRSITPLPRVTSPHMPQSLPPPSTLRGHSYSRIKAQ